MTWNEAYLYKAEQNFDAIIKSIYEEHYIDTIFEKHSAKISKENFIRAISDQHGILSDYDLNPFDGDGLEYLGNNFKGTCSWLFTPSQVRKVFKKYVKKEITF